MSFGVKRITQYFVTNAQTERSIFFYEGQVNYFTFFKQ